MTFATESGYTEALNLKYPVRLADSERLHLEQILHAGTCAARTQTRVRILLLSDTGQGGRRPDREIASVLGWAVGTLVNVRRRFCQAGLAAALTEQARPGAAPKVTGDLAAQLTLLACSDPPAGRRRRTLRLLAGRLVELGRVDSLSPVTVGDRLKKRRSSPGQ